ncbi:hypothetical protein VUN82_24705 [Micrococcaceae bacterium Sec5.1]
MVSREWRYWAASVALLAALPLAACDGSPGQEPPTNPEAQPISVEVNQSRDQYGKQAILIQLTNTADITVTVSGARLKSALFEKDIIWEPTAGALELPPRQPKSLPANLPAPHCGQSPTQPLKAVVEYSEPAKGSAETSVEAQDPFNVLPRNADELCLAADAAAVAAIVLDPDLEVAPDGRTAVVRLVITPASTPGESTQKLTINSIDGTTLLAESPADPWPRDIAISSGAAPKEVPLTIRPARCDPHAVAEDKVGTLLPLRISVGAREGVLKIAAPNELRGRIYDFVTSACGGAAR